MFLILVPKSERQSRVAMKRYENALKNGIFPSFAFAPLSSELSEKSTELFCLLAIVPKFMQYFDLIGKWDSSWFGFCPKSENADLISVRLTPSSQETEEDFENTIISYHLNVCPASLSYGPRQIALRKIILPDLIYLPGFRYFRYWLHDPRFRWVRVRRDMQCHRSSKK